MAEILAQVDEQLTQAPPRLGRLPVRPQQRAQVIAPDRLAVRQGKAGQQPDPLARTDCDRIACRGLKFGWTKKLEPVTRHESPPRPACLIPLSTGPFVKAN